MPGPHPERSPCCRGQSRRVFPMSKKRATAYLVYAANLILIFAFWFLNLRLRLENQSTHWILEAGRVAGLLGVFSIFVQLFLISRTRWIEQAFGLDRLTRIHHLNSHVIIFLIVLHPVLISAGYGLRDGYSVWEQFTKLLGWEDVKEALVALTLFAGVGLASAPFLRKKLKYEAWYSIHLLAYAAILLAFGHQLATGSDFAESLLFRWYWYFLYAVTIGFLLLYRVAKPIFLLHRHAFRVEKVVRETEDVTSVQIGGKHLEKWRARAGQFVILRFLAKGMWLEAHPFSISCVPDERLRVTIKRVGDFTARVPDLKPGTYVLIDGPHGIFTAHRSQSERVLMIAGGIGITPLRSVSEELVKRGKDVILVYSSRKYQQTALKEELDRLAGSSGGHFKVHYVMSDDPSWQGRKGTVTKELIQEWVPDVKIRDVYVCGPPPMMRAMIVSLRALGVPASRIYYELFSL